MKTYTFTKEQVQDAMDQYSVTGAELAWNLMDDINLDCEVEQDRAADGVHSFFATVHGERVGIILQ